MKKDSFLNRDFLLLSQGQFVNQLGSQIALVATAVWLKQSIDSASLLGLATALSAAPLLLLAPLGGACADRWSRRNILIFCDVFCGLVALTLAILLQTHSRRLIYLAVGLLTGNLILSSATAFTAPAINALTPSLVPASQIGPAMAFAQAAGLLTLVLGQFLGGVLLTHFGPAVLFGVDAATYLVSAAAESFVRAPPMLPRGDGRTLKGIFDEMKEGLRYVWQRRGMRALLLAAIPLNFFSLPIIVLLPFYTVKSLEEPLASYGYLLAALSIGMLAGYGVGGKFPFPAGQRDKVVFACVLGCAVTVLALAFTSVLRRALIELCVLGCLMGVVTIISLSVFIQRTEPEKRGRVSAVLLMVTQGLAPLAMAPIGAISDMLGNNIRLLYGACGVLLIGVGLLMSRNRELREFLRSEKQPKEF